MYTASIGCLALTLDLPAAVLEPLRDELEPFIAVRDNAPQAEPLLALALRAEPAAATWREVADGERVVVDTSTYVHLASQGLRFPVEGGYVLRIDLTATYVFFDGSARRAVLYQPELDLLARDAARLIKSILIVLIEAHGGIQLHASGVTLDDGRAVLLLGDTRQGKTTLLLELLSGFRVQQLSCDAVVLLPDGERSVTVHGWPSPFSVSHGTLSDHPELAAFFPEDRRGVRYDTLWREGRKSILTSAQVVTTFGRRIEPIAKRIAHVVVVRFRPEEPTGLRPLTSPAEFAGALRSLSLGTRDPIYYNWHGYVVADEAAIERNINLLTTRLLATVPVTVMTWAPSAASLFKRIPELGRAHERLGDLLTEF